MKSILSSLAILSAVCFATSQAVTLYEHRDFQGDSRTYADNCGCTNTYDFNDKASSATLPYAKITFYQHENCQGTSKSWDGRINTNPSDFSIDGINDMITSFYITCSSGGGGGGGCNKCGQVCCQTP